MALDLISIPDVAKRLDCSVDTIYRGIKQEDAAGKRDAIRFIPGGRRVNSKYIVFRAIFEAVVSAKCIEQVDPQPIEPISFLVKTTRAAEGLSRENV